MFKRQLSLEICFFFLRPHITWYFQKCRLVTSSGGSSNSRIGSFLVRATLPFSTAVNILAVVYNSCVCSC